MDYSSCMSLAWEDASVNCILVGLEDGSRKKHIGTQNRATMTSELSLRQDLIVDEAVVPVFDFRQAVNSRRSEERGRQKT